MYVLHANDGTITGVITGDKNYGAQLSDHGHQWIFLADQDDGRVFNFDTTQMFVDVEKKMSGAAHPDCLRQKETLSLTCDKNAIAANGMDTATISGIPAGASIAVISDVGIEFDGVVDDGEIELTASDPTTYTVHITAGARYIPMSIQVSVQ